MVKIHPAALYLFISFILSGCAQKAGAQIQNNGERFVGIHFDFHAKATDTGIGRTSSEEKAVEFLKLVKPDYIQIDCKGHPGYASYPTKIGNAAPKISNDLMKIWRQATEETGVGLYAHYSGLMDGLALQKHPAWAVINADDTRPNVVSVTSSYADSILIPQLKELALDYKINGVWIDGDCWAALLDYSPAMVNAYKKLFPGQDVPKKQGDKNYTEWVRLNRDAYKKYFINYVNTLHAARPDFKIINNWAYSGYMQEKIDVNVDFLSGDIHGNTPYDAAFEGRYFASTGKPWDLMTWSLSDPRDSKSIKSYDHFIQEASNILALGGGFETYWQQYRDGSLPSAYFQKMKDIVDYCNQRKDYCFKGSIVPQVGLLLTDEIWKIQLNANHLYSEIGSDRPKEIFRILQEDGYSTDFINTYDPGKKLSSYPVIVLSSWGLLNDETLQELNNYVRNGGNILVIGANAARQFAKAANISLVGNVAGSQHLKLTLNTTDTFTTNIQQPAIQNNGRNIGSITNSSGTVFPAVTLQKVGKGNIGLVFFDVKNFYTHDRKAIIKNLIDAALKQLFVNPVSSVEDAPMVQQLVTRKNGHLFIHLINMSGEESSYEKIPPVSSFKLIVNTGKKPSSVLLQPENKQLNFVYKNNETEITIPGFQIYSIIQVD